MNRKWLEHEGPAWVDRHIITREQYEQILELYKDKKHAIGVLPLLGSILVGLGIFSFIAANWQDIPQLVRLVMIMLLMVAFYGGGELFRKSGHDRLGLAMTVLGLVCFGGGIVLIAQMFHLVSYDMTSFIVWGSVGTLLTYVYRSKLLYLLSLLIFTSAQLYAVTEHSQFSYTCLAIMVVGLGYYGWKRQQAGLILCFAASFVLQSLMLVIAQEWKFLWVFVPMMLLYALGDWMKERSFGFALQSVPLAAAFLFAIVMVVSYDGFFNEGGSGNDILAQFPYFMGMLVILFAISLYGKWRHDRSSSAYEWILAVPFVYLPLGVSVMYLLALFFFSFYVLWRGYVEQWRFKINFGTVLFICATMVAYFKLTWDFMDKSLFFIIGGLLLLTLSWFLNRNNKVVLREIKEGESRDE